MASGDILKILWYSTVPLQAFGANPILLHQKNGSSVYKVSLISVIYIFLIILLLICSLWYCNDSRSSLYSENGIALVIAHSEIRLIMGPICSIIMLLSAIISAPTACQVMSGLSEFSIYFPQHFSPLHNRCLIASSAVLVAILFVSYFYESFFEIVAVDTITHYSLDCLHFITFLISWMCFDVVSWGSLCHMLILISTLFFQFRALDNELQAGLKKLSYWKPNNQINVESKQSVSLPQDLRRYRRIYINLTCVADDINKTFGTRLLFIIGFNTILLCFSSFIILLNFAGEPNVLHLSITGYWLLSRIVAIIIAISPFCCITLRISGITTTVHNWIAKIDDDLVSRELNLFANEIKNKEVRFTAHNFFKLESSTMTAIFGATLSYLVTLVQFHLLFRAKPNQNIFTAAGGAFMSNSTMNPTYEPMCKCE